MDADHLDIYGDVKQIEDAFYEFADLVKNKETLLYEKNLQLNGKTVSVDGDADYTAENIRIEENTYVFDLKTPEHKLHNLKFHLPGHHNLINAVMALGMAILAGASLDALPNALESFKGVKRRFTYKIKTDSLVLIDDYAHHPTEINALYQAVSEMYPDDKKQIVFQPHLFSRTRDFITGFAQSLSQFDEVILLDIYPAREEPMEGVTSQWLLDQINCSNKSLVLKEDLPEILLNSSARVKLMVGAGDIGAEVNGLTKILSHEV